MISQLEVADSTRFYLAGDLRRSWYFIISLLLWLLFFPLSSSTKKSPDYSTVFFFKSHFKENFGMDSDGQVRPWAQLHSAWGVPVSWPASVGSWSGPWGPWGAVGRW